MGRRTRLFFSVYSQSPSADYELTRDKVKHRRYDEQATAGARGSQKIALAFARRLGLTRRDAFYVTSFILA